MKEKYKSGDVFQIELPNDLGFAYIKCVNLLELNPNARYPTLGLVYNYRSISEESNLVKIINKELILCPLLIAGILPAIKNKSWKLVGHDTLTEDEKKIPDYKKGEPDENIPRDWFYLIDADVSKKTKSTYEKVKHLESIGAIGSELIGIKIAMALLQDEGKKIENYFRLDNFAEREFYKQIKQIPPYYKIPLNMRGKAISV